MCGVTRTTCPDPMGHVHVVVSPAGRIGGVATAEADSMVFTKSTWACPKRWPRLARDAARLHNGPVTPAGHGMSGGAGMRFR